MEGMVVNGGECPQLIISQVGVLASLWTQHEVQQRTDR